MVALACAGQVRLSLSLAEAGADFSGNAICYSVDLVRGYRKRLPRSAHLYFLVGADAFLDIGKWRESEALLDSCDFIVVSRPGVRMETLRAALPAGMLDSGRAARRPQEHGVLRLRRSTVHLIPSVHVDVSSTAIRNRVARGVPVRSLVPAAVEEYICKQALYR